MIHGAELQVREVQVCKLRPPKTAKCLAERGRSHRVNENDSLVQLGEMSSQRTRRKYKKNSTNSEPEQSQHVNVSDATISIITKDPDQHHHGE